MMLALIAADMPDPNSMPAIGWVVLVLVSIVWTLNQVVGLIQSLKPKPSYEEKFASKVEHERLDHEFAAHRTANTGTHSQLFNRIAEVERTAANAINQARKEILDDGDRRKDEIIEAIREVKSAMEKDRDRLGKVELEVRENTGWVAAQRDRED